MDWREFNNACFTMLSGLMGGAFAVALMIVIPIICLCALLAMFIIYLNENPPPSVTMPLSLWISSETLLRNVK